jgi:hypothetical protein
MTSDHHPSEHLEESTMGLKDGRGEIDPQYTDTAAGFAQIIHKDIVFYSGIPVSHEDDRLKMTPHCAQLLRYLDRQGLIDMDALQAHLTHATASG